MSTYLYGAFNCMFLSCHGRILEWTHTLQLPECQELLAPNRRGIWGLSDCNWTRTHNHLVNKRTLNHLAKWLSVHLLTKWFWIRVQLQSQIANIEILSFRAILVFKLLRRKALLMNRNDNKNCWKVGYFSKKTANFTGRLLRNYK